MKKFLILTTQLFFSLCAIAQSVTSLGFKPQTVRPNEMTSYTISLKDTSAKINITDIPVPDGLQYVGTSRSEKFSMSSSQGTQRETQLSFNFIPIKAGEYEIKSWQLKDGSKVYDIASAKLLADPNAPQTLKAQSRQIRDPFEEFEEFFNGGMPTRRNAQASQQEAIDLNKEITLSLEFPKEKIYVGEAIECKVAIKFNRKIFDAQFSLSGLEPKIKDSDAFFCAGFKKEPYEKPAKDASSTTLYFDTVIIPLKAGKLDLQFEANGILVSRANLGGGFFSLRGFGESHQFTSAMKALKMEVLELPKENMPSDFSGAIGEFKIESASVDESSLSVGEPCILTVKISGKGNFERMSAPTLINKDGWKEYKPKASFVDLDAGYSISGTKTFEYTIIAQKPDLTSTPLAKLSYFDPNIGEYKTLTSSQVNVSVAPSKGYAKRKSDEQMQQKEKVADPLDVVSKNSNANISSVGTAWFWIIQGVVLTAVILFIIFKRNKLRLENDPEYARIVQARADLKSSLANAKKAAQKGDAKEFFESSSASLQNAISLISGLQAKAVTLSDAESVITSLQFKIDYLKDIKTFFQGADAITYAGQIPPASELNAMYQKLEDICSQISQK